MIKGWDMVMGFETNSLNSLESSTTIESLTNEDDQQYMVHSARIGSIRNKRTSKKALVDVFLCFIKPILAVLFLKYLSSNLYQLEILKA
jgi:hypothetical protein